MRTFVYSELSKVLTDKSHVAYCYEGKDNRGAIAIYNGENILFIKPDGYVLNGDNQKIEDYSNFELWAFIHEMDDPYFDIREEAVTRLYDVYCSLYNFIVVLQEYPFIVD